MSTSFRDMLVRWKPAVYAGVGLVLLLAAIIAFRGTKSSDPYSMSNMTRKVTVEFADTGDKLEMRWGQIETEIIRRPGMPSESEGVLNPKTGKPTGFPTDKQAWKAMIERLQKTKAALQK